MQPLSRLHGHAAARVLGKQARSATQAARSTQGVLTPTHPSATPAAFLAALVASAALRPVLPLIGAETRLPSAGFNVHGRLPVLAPTPELVERLRRLITHNFTTKLRNQTA